MPSEFADVEWIARTDTVQVRVLALDAARATPWHFHSIVTDDVFCLEAGLRVDRRGPDEAVTLAPGERCTIAPGRIHRVVNTTERSMRYLLVQATGAYDFNEVG